MLSNFILQSQKLINNRNIKFVNPKIELQFEGVTTSILYSDVEFSLKLDLK